MRSFSPDVLLPIYGLGVIGAFLQISAAQWDISWHIMGIVETFFQPAHFMLYTGIGSVAIAAFFGLRYGLNYEGLGFKQVFSYVFGRTQNSQPYSKLLTGVRIAAIGSGMQLVGGPADFYWHARIGGFDPVLFTPPHSLLIIGLLLDGVGMLLGSVRLLQAQREGFRITSRPRTLTFLVILGLASTWLILNLVGYWVTDTTGMAYTFGYCTLDQFRLFGRSSCAFYDNEWSILISLLVSSGLFAAAGVVTFLTARTLFVRRGILTLASLLSAAVYSLGVLGFTAYVLVFVGPPGTFYLTNPTPDKGVQLAMLIPLYLLNIVPISLFDMVPRLSLPSKSAFALAGMLGPFAAFIEGRYASMLVGSGVSGLILVIPAEIIGGILAVVVFVRLRSAFGAIPVGPLQAQLVAPAKSAAR